MSIYSGKSQVFGHLFNDDDVPENVRKAESKNKRPIHSKNANKRFNQSKEPQNRVSAPAKNYPQHGLMASSSKQTKEEASALLTAALASL